LSARAVAVQAEFETHQTLTPGNQETRKPGNQETGKPGNQDQALKPGAFNLWVN
jgi:hypothetical protein